MTQPGSRVIVAVDDSLAGLRAMRHAAALAFRSEATLVVVRVVRAHRWSGRHDHLTHELRKFGAEYLDRVMGDALGGDPPGLDVERVVLLGDPGPRLVALADREDDLLIIGSGDHRRHRRWFGGRVARYCVTRATCPVLAVPPPELAVLGSARSLSRKLLRQLDDDLVG